MKKKSFTFTTKTNLFNKPTSTPTIKQITTNNKPNSKKSTTNQYNNQNINKFKQGKLIMKIKEDKTNTSPFSISTHRSQSNKPQEKKQSIQRNNTK